MIDKSNATLHIVSKAYSGQDFADLICRFDSQDSVIFIQDGCYCLYTPAAHSAFQYLSMTTLAIEADLVARNLQHVQQISVEAISYERFVDLTLTHKKTISW